MELLHLQESCCCFRTTGGRRDRKRQREVTGNEHREKTDPKRSEMDGQTDQEEERWSSGACSTGLVEEDIWRLQEENDGKRQTIAQLREQRRVGLEAALRRQELKGDWSMGSVGGAYVGSPLQLVSVPAQLTNVQTASCYVHRWSRSRGRRPDC